MTIDLSYVGTGYRMMELRTGNRPVAGHARVNHPVESGAASPARLPLDSSQHSKSLGKIAAMRVSVLQFRHGGGPGIAWLGTGEGIAALFFRTESPRVRESSHWMEGRLLLYFARF
jgi:hypothetical protein